MAFLPSFSFSHMACVGALLTYGANLCHLLLHWDTRPGVYVEMGEGIELDRRYGVSYGEIIGPRDEFTARAANGMTTLSSTLFAPMHGQTDGTWALTATFAGGGSDGWCGGSGFCNTPLVCCEQN